MQVSFFNLYSNTNQQSHTFLGMKPLKNQHRPCYLCHKHNRFSTEPVACVTNTTDVQQSLLFVSQTPHIFSRLSCLCHKHNRYLTRPVACVTNTTDIHQSLLLVSQTWRIFNSWCCLYQQIFNRPSCLCHKQILLHVSQTQQIFNRPCCLCHKHNIFFLTN